MAPEHATTDSPLIRLVSDEDEARMRSRVDSLIAKGMTRQSIYDSIIDEYAPLARDTVAGYLYEAKDPSRRKAARLTRAVLLTLIVLAVVFSLLRMAAVAANAEGTGLVAVLMIKSIPIAFFGCTGYGIYRDSPAACFSLAIFVVGFCQSAPRDGWSMLTEPASPVHAVVGGAFIGWFILTPLCAVLMKKQLRPNQPIYQLGPSKDQHGRHKI